MLNDFLTHTLQVVILLDVIGIIAWFVLAARRSPEKEAPLTEVAVTTVNTETHKESLWGKLTGSGRSLQVARAKPRQSLDEAFRQLRRVFDDYGRGLA